MEAMKEAAVDCELFKNHNMMIKINCFKFNEQSLFEENVGPAYNNMILIIKWIMVVIL